MYVSDGVYGRILRWLQGVIEPIVVVGEKGTGNASNQLHCGGDMSFDREGNLYVLEVENHRVQRFSIEQGG